MRQEGQERTRWPMLSAQSGRANAKAAAASHRSGRQWRACRRWPEHGRALAPEDASAGRAVEAGWGRISERYCRPILNTARSLRTAWLWLRLLLLIAARHSLHLTGGWGGGSLGSGSAASSLCPRLILRLEVDRRLGDRLFLTYQAVLTSCDVAEIPLTPRCPDRLGDLAATVSINSRQILMTPQTHAWTAFRYYAHPALSLMCF